MTKEIKYCMCGHRLKPNHQNEAKFLKWKYNKNTRCNSCYCSLFINRKRPKGEQALGYACLGIGLLMMSLAAYAAIIMLDTAEQHKEELKKQPAQLSMYDLLMISACVFLLIILLFNYMLINPFLDMIYTKKHKQMPIDDRDPHE